MKTKEDGSDELDNVETNDEGQHGQFSKVKSNEAKVKHDIDVIETINIELEHSVAKLLAENEQLHKEKEHLKQTYKDLFDSIKRTRVQTKDQNDSLMAQLNKKSNENADVLAQIQKKGFAIAALKNELRKLTGNSVNTKFAKPSILGKPVGQPLKNQSVVRQPTAFKSERPRISKPRFASQVDVNNDLSKPVTTHHLPKGRESAPAKPHHMIAPSSSRYSSNDIVHNHYLEEAKKKTHEHSRIPRNFSDSKHFVCSTCQKCVFNANHDACVIKFLKEVNSRAKVPSNKTTNRNKPVEQIRVATKPKRQIPKGHRFSIKKTTTVHEKTTSPRSCLRWQPTGRILKTVCLRWVPTGKTFASSTTKVESEPPNGSNADIPNQCESEQALNVSAGTLLSTDLAPQRQEMSVENVSSGLVPQGQKASDYDNSDPVPPRQNVVPIAEKTDSSQQGLEFLFSPLLEEYYNRAHGHAEDNNNDQARNASVQEDEFINPFCHHETGGLDDGVATSSQQNPKSSQDDGSKPSSDDEKKVDEDPRKDCEMQQKKDGIFVSQDKYVGDILQKFRFTEVKTAKHHTNGNSKSLWLKDGSMSENCGVHIYWSMIGSLMYLTSTRLDHLFAVWPDAVQVNDMWLQMPQQKLVYVAALVASSLLCRQVFDSESTT
ncbi:hypothetical protein Tco_1016289 [Tanacetum coccineum]|uniref:Uncharacterized protein n=1 Tax=Tanacetum coccineum TaxID=301880 RepID=A0ABQ5FNR8_9ASTR